MIDDLIKLAGEEGKTISSLLDCIIKSSNTSELVYYSYKANVMINTLRHDYGIDCYEFYMTCYNEAISEYLEKQRFK